MNLVMVMAKILFVEDDLELAANVSRWLSAENHTVEHVANGREGLDRALLADYDLIVLDWNLPELDGIDICKQYRDNRGKTPVMMLTGRNADDEKAEGLDTGADDYLCKPF
ncbi:MAG: response regulator transcription factor, partial [Terriglobales bacterium]